MIVKPYISFLNFYTDAQLAQKIAAIMLAMTGNKYFLTPSPTLVAVLAALKEFTDGMSAADAGGSTLTAIKNAKRAALVSLVRALALYVQANCNNDLAILKSSGFPTQKPQSEPIGEMPVPSGFTVALGLSSGKLEASVDPVPGASIYNWRVSLASAPGVIVQTGQSSATTYTFTALTPGLVYLAEANVFGAAGPSGWTAPLPQMMV